MKHLVSLAGRQDILAESAALHTDEIGSDIHRGTRTKLIEKNVPFSPRKAWLLTAEKASEYDLLIAMDDMNISDLNRLVKDSDRSKVKKLLSFTGSTRSIADPWFTGNFDETYNDVLAGCTELLKTL